MRTSLHDSLAEGLREYGYVEGENIRVEYRFAEGQVDRLPALAEELVSLRPEVLVLNDTPSAAAAKKATEAIPLVTAIVGDPVGSGFVASLARPGGNITGLTTMSVGLTAKRLQLLKEMVPSATRIGVLWDPANPVREREWSEAQLAAPSVGVEVSPYQARGPEDIERALEAAAADGLDGLLVAGEPLFVIHRDLLVSLADQHKLAALYEVAQVVESGGLAFYGVYLPDLLRRSAGYVDKILKGASPAELPVEQPTRFQFVVNLRAVNNLGITIPATVLQRADRLIE